MQTRRNGPMNVFDLMDGIFNDAFNSLGNVRSYEPVRFNKMISSGSFPPTDVIINQTTKVMTIKTALAGIDEDHINLSFDGDYLKLTLDVPPIECDKDDIYIQSGLKRVSKLETSWAVDPRFYSREDVETTFKNGLLTIVIQPKEDVKPRQKKLFGNLDTTKIEEKKE